MTASKYDREPGVLLRRSPDREHETPTRAKDSPAFGQCLERIDHQHVAEPTENRVEGLPVVEVQTFSV
jgi:hypothetical protein